MKIKNLGSSVTLSDILFDVEKVLQTEYLCNKDCAFDVFGYPIIDGERTKIRLNTCSDIYALVPNTEIFPVVEQILRNANIEFSASYRMDKHSRFYVTYVIEDQRYAYKIKGTNDYVKPQLMVMHSYNGLTKYKIIFGYFRLVCTNGLTIPVADMKAFNLSLSGKHTESIKHSLMQLAGIIQLFSDNAANICNSITAKFDTLADFVPENVTDQINAVLKFADIKPIENSKFSTLQYIIARAENEANNVQLGYKGTVNNWLVYNAINAYLFDSTLNITAPETQLEKDSKVMEFLLKVSSPVTPELVEAN